MSNEKPPEPPNLMIPLLITFAAMVAPLLIVFALPLLILVIGGGGLLLALRYLLEADAKDRERLDSMIKSLWDKAKERR